MPTLDFSTELDGSTGSSYQMRPNWLQGRSWRATAGGRSTGNRHDLRNLFQWADDRGLRVLEATRSRCRPAVSAGGFRDRGRAVADLLRDRRRSRRHSLRSGFWRDGNSVRRYFFAVNQEAVALRRSVPGTGKPFDRRTIHRYVERVARRAGRQGVHPLRLRHTLATQCLNRGMSLEAIAALY
jgi:integrase